MFIQAVRGLALALILTMCGVVGHAAQYAALVMDARTGEIVHARNANTKLHPASLTKMMTLYVVFDEIRRGRLSLDQKVTVSNYASRRPPSKLGLRSGQQITIRNLIRAAAVKSANDAATTLAEAVSGSEAAFAQKMTNMARAMGMSRTTFKNPHGLTQSGHLSTAHDMAILGRRLFYDFPQYYNIFSRRSTSAGVKTVNNTNRRLLNAYEGADGIKTGYTRAAGYNLVASARRGQERVIVSMFGGTSTAQRNGKVAELMDLGFQRMPSYANVRKPGALNFSGGNATAAAARADLRIRRSASPMLRSDQETLIGRSVANVNQAVELAEEAQANAQLSESVAAALAQVVSETVPKPVARATSMRPRPRPQTLRVVSRTPAPAPVEAKTVTVNNSGSWGVQLGQFVSRNEAERLLLTTALQDMEALDGGVRKIAARNVRGTTLYEAQFVGLSKSAAENACARLEARQASCEPVPGG